MKISDIISEAKLRKGAENATPDMETWPALNNNNSPYAAYRFGLALAMSPNTGMDKDGPIGGDFTTIAYSKADEEILNVAAKAMGVQPTAQTSKGSHEMPNVNKTSITKGQGPITLKKKATK